MSGMIEKLSWLNSVYEQIGTKLRWLPPSLARLTVGVVFLHSGWGKLNHLDKVVGFFESLGIPFAGVQAPFVASLEFFGGVCLLLGLATRLFSVPLAFTMVVAIATAKLEDVGSVNDLFGLSEYLYIVLLGWLVVEGPGRLSIDHLIKKRFAGESVAIPAVSRGSMKKSA